jgi:hypothetical protein
LQFKTLGSRPFLACQKETFRIDIKNIVVWFRLVRNSPFMEEPHG